MSGVGATLVAGSTMVSNCDVVPVTPNSSFTVRPTVKVPAPVYVRFGIGPVPKALAWPNDQA